MKSYIDEITEEMISSNEIEKIQTLVEAKANPRMIIKYNDGKEKIIDGHKEITEFVEKLKQK